MYDINFFQNIHFILLNKFLAQEVLNNFLFIENSGSLITKSPMR